jgi:hypothetical protein
VEKNSISRMPISGTALSGRKRIGGRLPVRSDFFHRKNVQRSAVLSCKRELSGILSLSLTDVRLYATCRDMDAFMECSSQTNKQTNKQTDLWKI